MKTKVIKLIAVFMLGTGAVFAQDIAQSQVPSIILNEFKKEFPKATDIEWEKKGDLYNVEFEIEWFNDHEAWYNTEGKMVRYKEEISEKDLPKAVKNTISDQYKGYRVDDAEKIITDGVETYKVEIEKGNEEIDLIFSKNGEVIPF